MKLLKRVLVILTASLVLGLTVSQIGDFGLAPTAEASLKSTVSKNTTTTLTNTVDSAGKNVVKLARDIAVAVLVFLICWMGYSLFFKKSAEGLADLKGRMGLALAAVAFIFFPEQILGAIFGIFGVKLT
ncbi:hypothetical protein [Cytobacillus pseudoceanisediminis]|uniref:hypothetical protein n=1 Tax=Cytobacillus pseudoceanisediminis TaxID=3051614 RepID=UPI003C2E59D8